jgi:hypothetical protein
VEGVTSGSPREEVHFQAEPSQVLDLAILDLAILDLTRGCSGSGARPGDSEVARSNLCRCLIFSPTGSNGPFGTYFC